MKYFKLFLIIIFFLTVQSSFSDEVDFSGVQDLTCPDCQEEFNPVQIPTQPVFTPPEFSKSEIVFKKNSIPINTIDPSSSYSAFPGGRGANQLIIYTASYGLHTGTNEFGTEAIVDDTTVTSLSGADSVIPQNGIVISGHGSAKNWINQNISVGSKIYVDYLNKVLYVYTTSDSYIFEAQNKVNEAQSIVDYYKNSMSNYNDSMPSSHINAAKNYLKLADSQKQNSAILRQYTSSAIEQANLAIKTSLPYLKNELKGIWVRPTEKTESQIISTIDNIKNNGFDSIFLETYYHGKTIFPSEVMNRYGFIVQNENFAGIDPLSIWIKEAHKRGMKVHIWFQSFYVGNEPPYNNPSSILSVQPEWGNKTKRYYSSQGATRSISEHNGYFLDPANPEVHEFLEELLNEIIVTYKPDGINLDYIRYPNANSTNDMNSWGFTTYARNDFKSLYGSDPVDLVRSDILWYNWNQYRRDKVTQFVREVGELCRANKVKLTTVIFPDVKSALSTKQQDWRTWSTNRYIDGFTPLFLTYDSKMLSSMMKDVMNAKDDQTSLYAGIFVTFMGGSGEDLIRQIYETRKMNANGIILFDYAHTTGAYTSTLMAGAFNSGEKNSVVVAQKKRSVFSKKESKKKEPQNQEVKASKTSKGGWIFSKN